MIKSVFSALAVPVLAVCALAQASSNEEFKLALPEHTGRLFWSAPGFKITEASVKPSSNEIGLRGQDASGITFLGFLFLFPDQAPMTSAKCRDGVMEPAKKENHKLKVVTTSEQPASSGPPTSLVNYVAEGQDRKPVYSLRAFVATADICGDLELYSKSPLPADDPVVKTVLSTYRLQPDYVPDWKDAFLYAQILYKRRMYKPAGPMFEVALAKLSFAPDDNKNIRRVLTDQAGMSYGISGDIAKARAIFNHAVEKDPDYPMYNLACADAEEKKLSDAQIRLQQAFARKANLLPGEKMPDPTKDDSFVPYRNNKGFWAFLSSLQP